MRVAIYARVSTSHQAPPDHRTATRAAERHVMQHAPGLELDEDHVFRDDGYSGAMLPRPGLDRLRDAARHEVDRVLITAPDRLARNYVHQMVLLEELHGRLPGRVPRPADERRPPRPTAAADPRRGGRVRAHADRRAHAPRAARTSCGPGCCCPGRGRPMAIGSTRSGRATPPACVPTGRGGGRRRDCSPGTPRRAVASPTSRESCSGSWSCRRVGRASGG